MNRIVRNSGIMELNELSLKIEEKIKDQNDIHNEKQHLIKVAKMDKQS